MTQAYNKFKQRMHEKPLEFKYSNVGQGKLTSISQDFKTNLIHTKSINDSVIGIAFCYDSYIGDITTHASHLKRRNGE